jgi:hypothetical protein
MATPSLPRGGNKPASSEEVNQYFMSFYKNEDISKLHYKYHKTEIDFENMFCRLNLSDDSSDDYNDNEGFNPMDESECVTFDKKAMMNPFLY